ncbi:hypothetical protein [Nitrosospira multiformis]|uniref:PEP-CTERM protein-sorting domain-containing protein n=1 Tax=Nitrosospira multiformis TaxID=1231 RepID=A0A1I7IT58_9PROT|nr:hypothetical protein [Nitrosospira multiformis]SFU76087.1 PEP-CTERM protein-sorting domain-containing protein [Nitrosospira multiformis]
MLCSIRNLLFFLAIFSISEADAGLVTVSGEFLTFSASSVVMQYGPTVNGVSLTQSDPGSNRIDTLDLAPGTSQVDFTYFNSTHPFYFNSFAFTPAQPADIAAGDTFSLGTFTFTNGIGFQETEITFKLTTHSSDPELDNHIFTGTMHLVVNAGTTDPHLAADYFFIAERPDLGSARVFDGAFQPPHNPGNTGTFDFYGRIGSLIPMEFVATNDAGFVSPKIGPLLPTDIPATAIPVPGSGILILTGLAALFLSRQSRNKQVSKQDSFARWAGINHRRARP